MPSPRDTQHRPVLQRIAHRVMIERGLEPDFPADALAQLDHIQGPAAQGDASVRDLRNLLWCSIDNDNSRDLDQLSVAEAMPGGSVRIRVAIADVDALVKQDSPLDEHAQKNTTSVYTAAQIFPMLPEKLSTDLTSLNHDVDRMAMVVDMVVGEDGALDGSEVYRALVRNHAKLAYNSVAAWLEGNGPAPDALAAVNGLEENLRLQDATAQKLKALRHRLGALTLETIEVYPVFDNDEVTGLEENVKNRAKEIIEDFMIAANGVTARFLESHRFSSVRRVVRVPRQWDGIVALAEQHGTRLPIEPDVKSLQQFLVRAKEDDPLRFPDLSLAVIKLLGAGEYVVERPGDDAGGHFGLAVKDYAHSTAPNRRYPDLITQRLLKAALAGQASPYADSDLEILARHCTEAEDAAQKVERQVAKSAAAILLQSRIGEQFDGIVTGMSDKGTWVRVLHPVVEGRLDSSTERLQVGSRLRVRLVSTNVERGFIDFKRVK
jgi:exoribonuclease-2